jgi:hypothetical protein
MTPEEASASDIQANQGLVPFDKDIHTPRDVGFGGPSTEYTMTVDAPDGQVAVIPSIWWDTNGEPVVLDQREAAWASGCHPPPKMKKRCWRRLAAT